MASGNDNTDISLIFKSKLREGPKLLSNLYSSALSTHVFLLRVAEFFILTFQMRLPNFGQ